MRKCIFLLMFLLSGCISKVAQEAVVPQRIVSLAPSITEILFAMGAGDKVVGVTTYCNYPKAAKELPKIGNFAAVDFEKIVALKPDLVIVTTDGNPCEVIGKLESLGIRTLVTDSKSFAQLLDSIDAIGKAVGKQEEAQGLLSKLKRDWESIGEKHREGSQSAVLLLYGISPLVAAGEGSLGDELVRQAGGRNIFGDSGRSYVTTDLEKVISLSPEVIIQVAMGSETNEGVREGWSRWSSIPAAKNGRIWVLTPDLITRPGPRIIEGLKLIEKAIHGNGRGK